MKNTAIINLPGFKALYVTLVIVSLLMSSFVGILAVPQTAFATGDHQNEPNDSCPFSTEEYDVVINFYENFGNDSRIRSDTSNTTTGPLSVSVPAGTYKVTLASSDGYNNRSNANQPNEIWKLVLKNDATIIAESGVTTDLADDVDFVSRTDVVNEELVLSSDANSATALHGVAGDTSSPNSLNPICAGLTLIPEPEPVKGSITVCKAILDEEGDVVNGSEVDATFKISGLDFNTPAGVLSETVFNTPLTYNRDIFNNVEGKDAKCQTYSELPLGDYYYGEEVIESDGDWKTPLYNDQNSTPVQSTTDLFAYSGELFTPDTNDDEARNTDSDGHIVLSEGRPDRTLVVLNQYKKETSPEPDTLTIVATKIVCEDEASLPNWGGESGNPDITETTAADWVASHQDCYLEEGWDFEWAPEGTPNPGDHVETAGGNWTTFGPTDVNGIVQTEIKSLDLSSTDFVWVRESFKDGYIPFTGVNTDQNVSAEMYCHIDNLNYDNYDRVDNLENDGTYYCVAWNVEEEDTPPPADNSCPFDPQAVEGRIIIDFEDGKKILDTNPTFLGPESVNVPVGKYKISLASFDGYENRYNEGNPPASANQPFEQWELLLLDGSGTVATSNMTDDLPDNVDFVSQIDVVNTQLTVSTNVNKAKAVHAFAGAGKDTANSVEPVCAALDPIPEPPQCSDGKDNDYDGKKDYPHDPGCDSPEDDDEKDNPPPKQCSDNKDNDNDGLTDEEDPGCWTDPEDSDTYDPNDDDETHIPPYAPYCGDGNVNQSWEACDGGDQCTEQCLFADQCAEIALAKVAVDESNNHGNGNFTEDVYLGSDTNRIPAGTWFPLYMNGIFETDADIAGYEDVAGFAVERQEGTLRVVLHGSLTQADKESAKGSVHFWNIDALSVAADSVNPLEGNLTVLDYGMPSNDYLQFIDETHVNYAVSVNVADDGFITTYDKDNPPMCQLPPDDPVCSDGADNDDDLLADTDDPGCHTDGDPNNPDSYDPNDDDENEKPVITLIGNSSVDVMQNTTYNEEGANVNDPEDGDIDGNLVIAGDIVDTSATGTYIVTYNAQDLQGLAADEVTRTVNVLEEVITECNDGVTNDADNLVDTDDPGCHTDGDPNNPDSYDPNDDDENEKPVITLNGDATVTITQGDSYTDAGATANDPEDGDITNKILVVNPVDTDTVGSYTITYNATDTENVAADEVTRTVHVNEEENPPVRGCTNSTANNFNPNATENDGSCTFGGGGGGGPIPDSLRIYNERVQVISEGTALITWNTNKPATSRVVYDDDSHTVDASTLTFGTGSDDLDYEFTTNEVSNRVTEHSVIVTNVDLENTFYFRPISRDNTRAIGIELNAVLGQVIPGGSCEQYLFEFIRFGANNNPVEVRKLQTFLNEFEGNNLAVDGVYNQATFNAVVNFQNKHAGDVLSPWGLEQDTGYVYLTTRKKINEIYCNNTLQFPLTAAQQAEVEAFRALLQSLEATGQPLPDTSNVGVTPSVPSAPGLTEGDTETPNVTLTEETEEETELAEEETDNSLAAAIEASEEENGGGWLFRKIGDFFRNFLR